MKDQGFWTRKGMNTDFQQPWWEKIRQAVLLIHVLPFFSFFLLDATYF